MLDVKGASPKPKAEVNMYDRHPSDQANQIFYQDDEGVIRSSLNRYTFDSESKHIDIYLFIYLLSFI